MTAGDSQGFQERQGLLVPKDRRLQILPEPRFRIEEGQQPFGILKVRPQNALEASHQMAGGRSHAVAGVR